MNKFDKNFHLNFLPLYGVIVFMLLMAFAYEAKAEEVYIEEIVVVGTTQREEVADVTQDFSIAEVLMPAMPFTVGGYGGFVAFSERGTQANHTAVFRNGVPVNDSGAGWYDLAHDLPTGFETIKVVDGPNSVLYGSGSLGGTVLIADNIGHGLIIRGNDDHGFTSLSFNDIVNVSIMDTSNDSVRTDNEEEDFYLNSTVRTSFDAGVFNISLNYTDYEYDYDNCYAEDFSQTNDCVQLGEKIAVSVRSDFLTIGYNSNQAEYLSKDVPTWESDAERYFIDVKEHIDLGYPPAELILGITANQEKFNGLDDTTVSAYSSINWNDTFSIGLRVTDEVAVMRAGIELGNFFVSAGQSYREPSLYEKFGDAWVDPNPDLEPEDALGFEIGYGVLSYFKYDFTQGVDYSPGYTYEYLDSEGNLVSEWNNGTYVNTGEYKTEGFRFMNMYNFDNHTLNIMLGYTDSDNPRVPEFKSRIGYTYERNNYVFNVSHVSQLNRGKDVMSDIELDNINTFDIVLSKQFSNNVKLSLTIQDVADNRFEIVPGYGAGGRNFYLTLERR